MNFARAAVASLLLPACLVGPTETIERLQAFVASSPAAQSRCVGQGGAVSVALSVNDARTEASGYSASFLTASGASAVLSVTST